MPQVAKQIRKERAARLRTAGETQMQKFFTSLIGKETNAIMEKEHSARTDHFAPVMISGDHVNGNMIRIKITGMKQETLTGEVLH